MSETLFGHDPTLAAFRAELLRWNRQINLVSRRDTPQRIDDLIRQCAAACDVMLAQERAEGQDLATGHLLYCDVGSGGGLPGFVWHKRLLREACDLRTWLVEPREKRAWFLRRAARLLDPAAYRVLQGRWGEVTAPVPPPVDTVLISLKALRLKDPDVLAGLEAMVSPQETTPTRVVIARFHPADEAWSRSLAADLSIAPAGEFHGRWQGYGAGVLPVAGQNHEPASLVVSRYRPHNS